MCLKRHSHDKRKTWFEHHQVVIKYGTLPCTLFTVRDVEQYLAIYWVIGFTLFSQASFIFTDLPPSQLIVPFTANHTLYVFLSCLNGAYTFYECSLRKVSIKTLILRGARATGFEVRPIKSLWE